VTPFADDGLVSDSVLAELIEDQLTSGVHGLVVAGGTGEGLYLDDVEVDRLLTVAVEAVASRVPMTAQIGALTTAQAVRNAKRALSHGAQVGMLPPSYYEPPSEVEILAHYAAVAEVGLPIMVYNNEAIGFSMSPTLIAQLAEIDGVEYLKDTTNDATRMFDIADETGGALQVLVGKDSLMLMGFLAGLRACVWGAPDAVPHACVELYRPAVLQANPRRAQVLWKSLYPVLRLFEREGYIPPVKAGTELRGIPVGPRRRPTLPLPGAKRERLAELMEALQAAEKRLATDAEVAALPFGRG
jgi:dihydrodipicolinate synthase/N-acetylneuraminate lyase